MKALLILLLASTAFLFSRAQTQQPPATQRPSAQTPQPAPSPSTQRPSGPADTAFQNAFSAAIEAVLHDFPDNMHHISGELVLAEGEIENFASTVMPPGAVSCIITRYHSVVDTTASWQAKMSADEDFGKASGAYHNLYKRLTNCYLRLADSTLLFLKGDWEPARESISFTTSTLRLQTGDPRYKEMKVELELVYQLPEWVVNINIVSKKADDEMGAPIRQ
ncbi:MAG TPA: hypothetical protein VK563_23455 [Puia sp.]|nr:hypothetical protein [Puia sp.]